MPFFAKGKLATLMVLPPHCKKLLLAENIWRILGVPPLLPSCKEKIRQIIFKPCPYTSLQSEDLPWVHISRWVYPSSPAAGIPDRTSPPSPVILLIQPSLKRGKSLFTCWNLKAGAIWKDPPFAHLQQVPIWRHLSRSSGCLSSRWSGILIVVRLFSLSS